MLKIVNNNLDLIEIKMVDFGFACHVRQSEDLTQSYGTAAYMAPEVLSGT